jgi:DHA2 family multidrug resistance protein-like MFS transporter
MPDAGTRAGRREWIGLAIIALPCLVYSMDLTVLDLALPHISAALRPTSAQMLWIIDIYGFVVAGLLIPMGALGDRIGRRRLLLLGAGAFGVASVLASFSRSAAALIAARAALGVAGATVAPSTLSLLQTMFRDTRQRTVAIGIWLASYSVGGAIGPLVGGVLLEHFRWGSVFLVGVPVMALLLVVGPALLPEYRSPDAGRTDFLSAAQSLAAVLLVIFGLKRIVQGDAHGTSALAVGGGIVLAYVFVRRQRALAVPLVDVRLFANPAFRAALVVYALGTFVTFGVLLFVGQYLQLVLDLAPLRAGIYLLPFFLGYILGALCTPRLAQHVRPATLMSVGMCMAAVGLAWLARMHIADGAAPVVVACAVFSLGISPVFTLATDLIVAAAPPERAGAAAALSETASELGGALGIALLGSVGTAVYRGTMLIAMPRDLSPAAAEAARGSLGGAASIATRLHGDAALALVRAATDAFGRSFGIASAVSAGLVLMTALAIVVTLRPAPGPVGE